MSSLFLCDKVTWSLKGSMKEVAKLPEPSAMSKYAEDRAPKPRLFMQPTATSKMWLAIRNIASLTSRELTVDRWLPTYVSMPSV